MSTMTTTLDSGTPAAEVRIPFATLVRVELRKAYDTRSGFWLLAITGGLIVLASLITALVAGINYRNPGPGNPPVPLHWDTFATVAGVITQLLIPVIGVLLVTSEWGQRTGMVTFALEPRRSSVVWAKMVVAVILTIATVIVAIVSGAIFNALYGAIAGHVDWSFDMHGFTAFLVVQLLTMLSCFSFAAIFLNGAAAIVFSIAAHFVIPGLIQVGENLMSWFNSFGPWIDFQASLNKMYDWNYTGKDWGELLTSGAIWFVLPMVLGLSRILRAEVK